MPLKTFPGNFCLVPSSQTTPTFSATCITHVTRSRQVLQEYLRCSLPSVVHLHLLSWNLQDRCSTGELILVPNLVGGLQSEKWFSLYVLNVSNVLWFSLVSTVSLPVVVSLFTLLSVCVDVLQVFLTSTVPGNMLRPLLSE